MASGQDNRKHSRFGAAFSVIYTIKEPFELRMEFGDKEKDGIAEDLSEGGLSLLLDFEIPDHTILNIRFRLLFKDMVTYRKFDLQGEVRHCMRTKEKFSYRAGIRFLNASRDDREFIAACI